MLGERPWRRKYNGSFRGPRLGVGVEHVKPRVYVETSVGSYLTAWPSRDVVALGNQVATRGWRREAANRFELVVSGDRRVERRRPGSGPLPSCRVGISPRDRRRG